MAPYCLLKIIYDLIHSNNFCRTEFHTAIYNWQYYFGSNSIKIIFMRCINDKNDVGNEADEILDSN